MRREPRGTGVGFKIILIINLWRNLSYSSMAVSLIFLERTGRDWMTGAPLKVRLIKYTGYSQLLRDITFLLDKPIPVILYVSAFLLSIQSTPSFLPLIGAVLWNCPTPFRLVYLTNLSWFLHRKSFKNLFLGPPIPYFSRGEISDFHPNRRENL